MIGPGVAVASVMETGHEQSKSEETANGGSEANPKQPLELNEAFPDPSGVHPPHIQELMHPEYMHLDHHDLAEDLSSPDHQEPSSPRRGFTHKRSEEPQRNGLGKMICKFQSTCSGLTFERRCEWR